MLDCGASAGLWVRMLVVMGGILLEDNEEKGDYARLKGKRRRCRLTRFLVAGRNRLGKCCNVLYCCRRLSEKKGGKKTTRHKRSRWFVHSVRILIDVFVFPYISLRAPPFFFPLLTCNNVVNVLRRNAFTKRQFTPVKFYVVRLAFDDIVLPSEDGGGVEGAGRSEAD